MLTKPGLCRSGKNNLLTYWPHVPLLLSSQSSQLVSEWKECSKFVENIGSSLLMLEACDDIVEELKDEAEPRSIKKILKWGQRKGPDCYWDCSFPWTVCSCVRPCRCQNIPENLVAHSGDTATNLLAAHCEADQRVCLPSTAAFL